MHQDAPGLVGDVAKWIDACAVHPAPVLSTAAALACCSAIVGRRYTCQGARGVLYVVAVAKSGVGKDVGRRCATNLLEKAGIGERVGTDDVASAAGLVKRLRECPVQFFPLDEFGRLVEAFTSKNAGNHERQIITTLMKLWSSCGDTYYGKAYADSKAASLKVENPACVVYGTTTPDVFYRALRGSDVVDGVLSRVLLVECDHGQALAVDPTSRSTDPSAELIERVQAVVRGGIGKGNMGAVDSADLRAPTIDLPMTAAAREGYQRIGLGIRPRLDGPFPDLWVRAREQALRVAVVVAAGCLSETVEVEHLTWAWRFVRWSVTRSHAAVIERVADTEEGRCALAILAVLDKRGTAGKGEITRAGWRFDARIRKDALAGLLDGGRVIGEPTTVRGKVVTLYRRTTPDEIAESEADSLAASPWETTVGSVLATARATAPIWTTTDSHRPVAPQTS